MNAKIVNESHNKKMITLKQEQDKTNQIETLGYIAKGTNTNL